MQTGFVWLPDDRYITLLSTTSWQGALSQWQSQKYNTEALLRGRCLDDFSLLIRRHNTYPMLISHYSDVIMGATASQITSLTIVYSTVYSSPEQREHQSSASLAFVRGIHRWPVNSPHKWPVTRKMFPFNDVIMTTTNNPKNSIQ